MTLAAIDMVVQRDIIRIEPEVGSLYYQAFLSKPEWLNVETRLTQPLEVTMSTTDPQGPGSLSRQFEVYPPNKPKYLDPHNFSFDSAAAAYEHLAAREDWETDSIFLIVPPGTTAVAVAAWYAPLHERFPTLFVFPQTPPTP